MSSKKPNPKETLDPLVPAPPALAADHPFAGPETAPEAPGAPDAAVTSSEPPAIVGGLEMLYFRNTKQGTEFDAIAGSNFAEQCLASPDLERILELTPGA